MVKLVQNWLSWLNLTRTWNQKKGQTRMQWRRCVFMCLFFTVPKFMFCKGWRYANICIFNYIYIGFSQQRCCLKLTWNKKKSANNDIGQWCETWPSCSNHFQFYFKDQYLLQPPNRRAVGGSLAAEKWARELCRWIWPEGGLTEHLARTFSSGDQ